MKREEIMGVVNEIAKEVFEDDELVLTEESVADEVDGWDSLTHLVFIAEIEKKYKIKFLMGEIQGFANVGELVSTIEKHIENN